MTIDEIEKTQPVGDQLDRHVMPIAWTEDRCKELDSLGMMLREIANINQGSHCIERIQRCIVLAEKLSRDDLFNCRDSLYNFLRRMAIADRSTRPSGELASIPAQRR